MSFFEQQARARRRSLVLVGYFLLAVLLTMVAVVAGFYLLHAYLDSKVPPLGPWLRDGPALVASLTVLAVVAAGSLTKLWQLRDGGEGLARLLKARAVTAGADAPQERQLINVVEEMAIAAGLPMPRLYVLDNEPHINAMVAGYQTSRACLFVTRGALEQLPRDELQGVIAHEFSHIFNADMRLNLHLVALLAGILTLGKLGSFLMRNAFHLSASQRHSRNSNKDSGGALFLVVGLLLVLIGYLGLLFGRLIKAAISRQREMLADAGAVQFTRNPAGLAGALTRLRNGAGTELRSVYAEDMSHMCFGNPLAAHRRWLATHPELDERLAALGPQWLARARVSARRAATPDPQQPQPHLAAAGSAMAFSGAAVAAQVGTVTPAHLGYAQSLVDMIPPPVRAGLREADSARDILMSLMVANAGSAGAGMLAAHPQQAALAHWLPLLRPLGPRMRLPLVDLALPALREQSLDARQQTLQALTSLLRQDTAFSVFEFTLLQLVTHQLLPRDGRKAVLYHRYAEVGPELTLLLSVLVHASGATGDAAEHLFQRSGRVLLPAGSTLRPRTVCRLEWLGEALNRLNLLAPRLKQALVQACADIVLTDGKVQVPEAELLRAVCATLECPMPPLLPSPSLAAER
ncbi:M48 family metalloprotease [Isoalcanivorax beigongshangi]|uniref:M48 family metalloprotease n=1 Tax=Isoalcanivorax beigongshangi TaxID=3238810 RepID=A0ABV4AER0_9GAMM